MMKLSDLRGKRVHMIAIGGSSMNGLARILKWNGAVVSGSDSVRSSTTDKLEAEGFSVTIGHLPRSVHGAQLVVYSAAIKQDNAERVEAERLGIAQIERKVLLGMIADEYGSSIAIAGTHGKSTVTSMLSSLYIAAGKDPTVHIGGNLKSMGGGVRVGDGDVFITEADEFSRTFLVLKPTTSVVLNINEDHLDIYKDIDDIENTFFEFIGGTKPGGLVIGFGGDERVRRILGKHSGRTVTFGLDENCDYYAKDITADENTLCSAFGVYRGGEKLFDVALKVPGGHNVLNALCVTACACEDGMAADDIKAGLEGFAGVERRFELTGVYNGALLYHDYGHTPEEYKTVVPMARKLCVGRLFSVFQPHTYSRTKSRFHDFPEAFSGSDVVVITDIFAAREKDPGDIHSRQLIEEFKRQGMNVVYTPTLEDAKMFLDGELGPGDVMISVGCGNVNLLNEMYREEDGGDV